jgi:hypothetical protein
VEVSGQLHAAATLLLGNIFTEQRTTFWHNFTASSSQFNATVLQVMLSTRTSDVFSAQLTV